MAFRVVCRIKAPAGFVGLWINLYGDGYGVIRPGGGYRRRIDADNVAKPWRHDCVWVLAPEKARTKSKKRPVYA